MNEERTDAEYLYFVFITLLIYKTIKMVVAVFLNMWAHKVILYQQQETQINIRNLITRMRKPAFKIWDDLSSQS